VPVADISDAVLVEETAIGTDLGGKFVFVVGSDNIVELRHIELGPLQDDGLRVVLSNLQPAESYIINGLQRARPGLPVTPTTGN
jgi:multidrug efflux system membrane fusion protein